MVRGIRLPCRRERKMMGYCNEVDIDLNDHKDVSPVPFSIARKTPFAVVKTTPCVENDVDGNVIQHATYMNIDLDIGLAPDEWQDNVGPGLIFRTDGVDFLKTDWDAAVNLVADTLDMFGEDIPHFDAAKYIRVHA